MEELFKLLSKRIKGIKLVESEKIVIKTVPMKKEWVAKKKEINKRCDVAELEMKKLDSEHRNFWSTIEIELDYFGDMRVNMETNEVELLQDKEEGKAVKSPFID